jgi:hypothetical protein
MTDTWHALLAVPAPPVRILYDFGSEHGMSLWGRVRLQIDPDGTVGVERRTGGRRVGYAARTFPEAHRALLQDLARSPFPAGPPVPPAAPPGTMYRVLTLESGPIRDAITTTWTEGFLLPYGPVFRRLDAIAHQATKGLVQTENPFPPLVTDLEER